MPWRIALYYSVGQVASALSGLLAYLIGFMNGLGHLPGWRWLFLLEGLPAIMLSVPALFGLPNYPQTARMLTAKNEHSFSSVCLLPHRRGKRRTGNLRRSKFCSLVRQPTPFPFTGLLMESVDSVSRMFYLPQPCGLYVAEEMD